MRQIDSKFHIESDSIIKTSNGEVIPEEEPVFLLRARDYLALRLLQKYRRMCVSDGCTDYQLSGVDASIERFSDFTLKFNARMKQPGITRGL